MKTTKSAVATASTTNGKASSKTVTTPPPATATAASATGAVTTIDVKLDVGFGNAVFLRGTGGGLTWERGIPLVCVDGKTWRWSGMIKDAITFKPLLNDRVWSAGNDLTVKPGQKLEIQPKFA